MGGVAVPAGFAWCSGSRHWTQKKLQAAKNAQVRMTRRLASWWQKAGEDFPLFVRRPARWSEEMASAIALRRRLGKAPRADEVHCETLQLVCGKTVARIYSVLNHWCTGLLGAKRLSGHPEGTEHGANSG